jgi:hypothetical protein
MIATMETLEAAAADRLRVLFGICPRRTDGIVGHAWKRAEFSSMTTACRFCGEPWPYLDRVK